MAVGLKALSKLYLTNSSLLSDYLLACEYDTTDHSAQGFAFGTYDDRPSLKSLFKAKMP